MSEITSATPTVVPWASDLVRSFEDDAAGRYPTIVSPDFLEFETDRRILVRNPAEQAEIGAAILLRLQHLLDECQRDRDFWPRHLFLRELAGHVLSEPLPYSEERLAGIIEFCATSLLNVFSISDAHGHLESVLKQVECVADDGAAHGRLAAAVARLSEEAMKTRLNRSLRGAIARLVDRLSGESERTLGLAASPWRDKVLADVGRLAAQPAGTSRRALEQAVDAVGKSKPSQAFLKAARSLLAEDRSLAVRIIGWIEAYVPNPGSPELNEDAIRGLIWMLAATDEEGIAARIGKYCELCFKKVPNIGARSTKLGNGAIQTLGTLGGVHAVAELTRLKGRVRYPLVVRRIETTLSGLAGRLGLGEAELEEMALPTFGLSIDGERRLPVGDGSAIIRVSGTREVHLSWARSDGREVASIPKALKEAAPEAVAAARGLKKEIEGALAGQCARIESLYLSDRRIAFDLWRERYLEHPLVAGLTRRLIWRFESSGRPVAGLARNGTIEDVAGHRIEHSPGASVTLWHPLHATASHVLDWRTRLATLGLSQPFKQAHREVYVVTDAERQTNIYSNRFAAHVLRQHQFKALCDQRGWRYHLMGAWDSHNTPTRTLPGRQLSVEYWVDMIAHAETTASAVYALISTDQVRFIGADRETIPLADVPPLLFSELMRDVDLFVGVASVGNDPNWVDGGPDGRFRNYWNDYAFGSLSETGKTRATVLATLLPQLAIAGQCALEERFLVVHGKLRTYRIHLGSANIQMEPNNQYLCIVPGRGQSDRSKPLDDLVLPFEGDNVLSIILSKAFLLAADDKITDPAIVRQIEQP
jgi:hypothetical protein